MLWKGKESEGEEPLDSVPFNAELHSDISNVTQESQSDIAQESQADVSQVTQESQADVSQVAPESQTDLSQTQVSDSQPVTHNTSSGSSGKSVDHDSRRK